jgi:hypothetical protein
MTTAYKTFHPVDLKLDDTGSVTVAFAQLNVIDHDGDLTLPGAMPAKSVPMSNYGHTSWDGALPIGRGSIAEEGGWAIFAGKFLMGTDQGRNAHATVKAMAELQEWSYGYEAKDFGYETREGQTVRILKRLDVFEVSPVLVGAGVGTHTRAIKSGGPGPDVPYAEHLAWVQAAVKALTDRTTDRAEWRAKEGRSLSVANLEQLDGIVKGLRGFSPVADELAALLEATDPDKAARFRAGEVEVLLAQARLHGVSV